MNFRQLEAFRAIMIHGSATSAGEALHITQPAVSRLLSDLEQALGLQLFERSHRRLIPTAEARLLYEESETVFGGLDRLREAALSLRDLNRGRIRIVTEVVYADGMMPRLIAEFQKAHPDIKIQFDTGPSASIVQWIELCWYDLGIVVLPAPQANVQLQAYTSNEAVCAMPADHPLAQAEEVDLPALHGERFIAPVPNSAFRFHFDRLFAARDMRPEIGIEMRTQHGMCAAVGAGAGIALVDPCVIPDVDPAKVRFLRIRGGCKWDTAIISPNTRPPSLICRDFVRFLLEAAAA
ncbi:LysR family transcriptional regulator [Roseovarius sp.]|uniref:LysR family transcriptional regulator n=1 Tax=Roseovarius sp. TaxID=1486281 RepID=UPI003BA8ED6A